MLEQRISPIRALSNAVVLRSRSLNGLIIPLSSESGQGFAEYAVIFSLVVLVAVVTLSNFGSQLGTLINNTVTGIIALLS